MAASDDLSRGLSLLLRPRQVEAALWRKLHFHNDIQSRERLFNWHHPMARSIASREFRRRPRYGLDRGDFEQLAFSGLLQAIDRFNPLHGAPFEAFAKPRIRGSIADGLAKSSESGAQFSHRRRVEAERIRSIRDTSNGDFISELCDLSVALALGLLVENARAAGGALSAQPAQSDYETLFWRDLLTRVVKEMERLPDAERTVLQQHYSNGVAFSEIAVMLNVSKGRVSQLHSGGLKRLRALLNPRSE